MSVHSPISAQTDDGSVLSVAAQLAVQADIFEDAILEADWQRECWEYRTAGNADVYWARRDREASSC